MPLTTNYRRGDIVLVPFPFTDLSASKQRPAVIVSPNPFNTHRKDILIVAITSQVPKILAEDEMLIPTHEIPVTGLLRTSIVKTSKIITIHQELVRKRIGTLSPLLLELVLKQIQKIFQP